MKIEVNVPTSLNEVTLGQYQKYWVFMAPQTESLFCCSEGDHAVWINT